MVWKIWSTNEPGGVYGIDASSFDQAIAAVRKIHPQADTGQPCVFEEISILKREFTKQSLRDGALIPSTWLNHYKKVVDRYN